MNDDYSKLRSYSLDPFPDCQMKKRCSDNFRKRKDIEPELIKIDCNGGACISQSQRSDHIPLLHTNRKRWHSLEMVRANADHEISGCEDLIDNSKKSLGRNIIKSWGKSWIVGIFQSSNGLKNSARNGSGLLLQQQSPTVPNKPDKETSIV